MPYSALAGLDVSGAHFPPVPFATLTPPAVTHIMPLRGKTAVSVMRLCKTPISAKGERKAYALESKTL